MVEFDKSLKANGYIPTQVDPQLYNKFQGTRLVSQLSGHIDDLKGGGDEAVVAALLKDLERRYGKLKVQRENFEHVGIQHERQPDGSYKLHQNHYIEQLRALSLDDTSALPADQTAPEHLISPFISLVCAMSWVLTTMPVVAVYVGALQRHLRQPTVQHLRDANRVLRYLKTRKPALLYRRLKLPLKLLMVADSAFTALDDAGLAIRGYFILLCEDRHGELGGMIHIIDYTSRKQSHVCRATFAAELFAVLDGIGAALKVLACFEEVIKGSASAEELARRQEAGQYSLPMHAVTDGKSVFDASSNPRGARTTEEHLLIHVLKLREFLKRKIVKSLWWADTRDMVADGLTKGSLDRNAILDLSEHGRWNVVHKAESYST